MTTYTTITNALVAVGAKPFATTIQALRDNPLAIAEGDATAPSLLPAIANKSTAGAVGTYAFLSFATNTTADVGSDHAGSGLIYDNASGGSTLGTPSGTWKLMGRTNSASSAASTSLFLRIA